MTPILFVARIHDGAQKCEIEKGIPMGFTIAQAALESAWGESKLTVKGNNLFGIKADKSWKGPTVQMMTTEHVKGQNIRVMASWRAYDSWDECLLDHANFFHANPRYSKALEYPHDSEKFAVQVAKAGYATDPEYADKLIRTMRSHKL